MYKNIIFIHLESINNLTFRMQPQLFPNLYKAADKGVYFRNYYSSATSTLMVMTDLMYGNMYGNEASTNLKDGYIEAHSGKSLFDDLKSKLGYRAKMVLWPIIAEQEKIVNRKIIGEKIDLYASNNYKQFKNAIHEMIQSSGPFALFIGDFATHIEYQKHTKKCNAASTIRWKDTRKTLDELCGEVIEWLEQEQKINDTIIVFYGDHGDDFWGHRLNNGYTHATEPYANVISTPLIMHIPGYKGAHIRSELVATIDIRDIVWNLVETDALNITYVGDKKHIFSRNLYAGQKARHKFLEKGYSVVNEEYLLMVTYRGLELYNHILDPQNTCNLLEFYKMNRNRDIVFNTKFKELKSGHFLFYFRTMEINHVMEQYRILRQALLKEVHEIYGKANMNQSIAFQELAFHKICNSHGYRLYNHKIVSWMENR